MSRGDPRVATLRQLAMAENFVPAFWEVEDSMRKTLLVIVLCVASAVAATAPGNLSFSNTPLLLLPNGSSEPEIAFHGNFMAITSLAAPFGNGTQLWTGDFGSTPNLQGAIDSALTKAGFAVVFGGGDADVDLGSTGALHATTLVIPVNKPFRAALISVAAITCPGATSPSFSISDCTAQIIDLAGNDRPWISSDGSR